MGAVNKVNGTAFEDNWRPLMLKDRRRCDTDSFTHINDDPRDQRSE